MSDLMNFFGQEGFDSQSVEPQEDFEVIPPGKYPVSIDTAEVKQTKSEKGHYLKLTLSILGGPFRNRKLWDQINIDNPNQICVEIGLRTLAALGQAIGIARMTNTDELIGKFCIAHVKVKNDQNSIRTYSPLTPGDEPGIPQQAVQQPGQMRFPGNAHSSECNSAQPTNQPSDIVPKPPWAR